jgi:hypothetical protein
MTGLNIIQYLTSDKDVIKKAIERAKEITPSQGEVITVGDDEPAAGGLGAFGVGSISVFVPGTAAFARTPKDFQVNMSEVAKAFQHIPGAKNIIFFSGRNAGWALNQALGRMIGREFASSNTPVFAVNTNGWIEKVKTLTPREKQALEESPLKDLAQASGGKYFAHINEVETIADEIQTLTANYYVLGYYITETWDGRYHEIKVEVKRPDCQVYVQEGYYGAKPYGQYSDLEKDLHLFDLIYADRPTTPGVIDAAAEALIVPDGRGSSGVILIEIPVDEKTGLGPGKAEFFLVVFDKERRPVISVRGMADLPARPQMAVYPYTPLVLSPGEYEYRFAARDMETGQGIIARSSFKIPEPSSSGMTLHTPLVVVPRRNSLFLKLALSPKGKEPPSSLIDFYPLFPKQGAPVVKTLPDEAKTLLTLIPMEIKGDQAPDQEIDFILKAAPDGEAVDLDAAILDFKKLEDGRIMIIAEVNLPEMRPGEYVLEIVATDVWSGGRSSVKTRFVKK